MAVLPIYNCFHPVMTKKTTPVQEIDDSIKELINNMFDTMYNTKRGVGLSANQVGSNLSIVVIDVSEIRGIETELPFIMINPVILEYSQETEIQEEGCLSIPILYDEVERSVSIKIRYQDILGKEIERTTTGFLARVMQHEVDHLNGLNFYNRLSTLRKNISSNKMKKLKKGIYEVDYDMIDADNTKHNA